MTEQRTIYCGKPHRTADGVPIVSRSGAKARTKRSSSPSDRELDTPPGVQRLPDARDRGRRRGPRRYPGSTAATTGTIR